MRLLIALLCFAATPAYAQVQVVKAWTRATPPGAEVAAGYMTLRNNAAQADRLVSVTSPAAGRVETHVTIRDGSISRMREVKGYEIPAGGSLELKPGGGHLMLVDIKAPFKQGAKVPVTLRFQRAGEVKAELQVEGMGAMGADHSSEMPGMKMH
jgi:periplasmic copper chaperone A